MDYGPIFIVIFYVPKMHDVPPNITELIVKEQVIVELTGSISL